MRFILRRREGDTYSVGSLERANLNQWVQFPKRCTSYHLDSEVSSEMDGASNILLFFFTI
jgi:hypothetical protein